MIILRSKNFSTQLPDGRVISSSGQVISGANSDLYRQHEALSGLLKKYRNREAFALGLKDKFPSLGKKMVSKYSGLVKDTIQKTSQPYSKILELERRRRLELQPVKTFSDLGDGIMGVVNRNEKVNKLLGSGKYGFLKKQGLYGTSRIMMPDAEAKQRRITRNREFIERMNNKNR